MRDRHDSLALHQPVKALLDSGLDLGVERAGRAICAVESLMRFAAMD
jgi:hypothetical protein